jgi:peroxiredoxin family protein
VPVVAAVMNLLAAAAALGVLVVVFQFGSGLHVLTSASRTSRILLLTHDRASVQPISGLRGVLRLKDPREVRRH